MCTDVCMYIYIWTRIRPYSVPEYAQMHFIHRMHRLIKKPSYSELPVIDFLWPWECQTSHELHPSTGYLTLRWPKAISWKIIRPQVTTCNFGAKVIVISTSHWNLILLQPLGFERPSEVSRCIMLNPMESIGGVRLVVYYLQVAQKEPLLPPVAEFQAPGAGSIGAILNWNPWQSEFVGHRSQIC